MKQEDVVDEQGRIMSLLRTTRTSLTRAEPQGLLGYSLATDQKFRRRLLHKAGRDDELPVVATECPDDGVRYDLVLKRQGASARFRIELKCMSHGLTEGQAALLLGSGHRIHMLVAPEGRRSEFRTVIDQAPRHRRPLLWSWSEIEHQARGTGAERILSGIAEHIGGTGQLRQSEVQSCCEAFENGEVLDGWKKCREFQSFLRSGLIEAKNRIDEVGQAKGTRKSPVCWYGLYFTRRGKGRGHRPIQFWTGVMWKAERAADWVWSLQVCDPDRFPEDEDQHPSFIQESGQDPGWSLWSPGDSRVAWTVEQLQAKIEQLIHAVD